MVLTTLQCQQVTAAADTWRHSDETLLMENSTLDGQLLRSYRTNLRHFPRYKWGDKYNYLRTAAYMNYYHDSIVIHRFYLATNREASIPPHHHTLFSLSFFYKMHLCI